MITQREIHEFLESAGIGRNDTVLIHTSMRALGAVEGGCDGLIDGFVSYLSDGLFLVPTHTWATVGRENPRFIVDETPPCIGALPSVAAFRKDGVRSLHPTHSVAAFGHRAKEFVSGEEKVTSPCPPDGVWARLLEEKAKILLLGVGLNRNTYLHAVDEMINLPHRLEEPIPLTVVGYGGEEYSLSFRKHSSCTGSENFGNYRKALEFCGALRFARLGKAEVGIFDTVKGTAMVRHLWSVAEYDLCAEAGEILESYYRDFIL